MLINGSVFDYGETRDRFQQFEDELGQELCIVDNGDVQGWQELYPDRLYFVTNTNPEHGRSREVLQTLHNGASMYYRNERSTGAPFPIPDIGTTITREDGAEIPLFEYDSDQNVVWNYFYVNGWEYHGTPRSEIVDEYLAKLLDVIQNGVDPAAIHERQERAIREWADQVYSRKVTETRRNIDLCLNRISNARNEIGRAFRDITDHQHLLDALLHVGGSSDHAREQWELLKQHPRIAQLRFNAGKFVITTTDDLRITREDTGESRWLGAFRIEIPIDGNGIKLHNLNTRRGGRNHPHVEGSGDPCFGGHGDAIWELLGRGEIYVVFDLCLQYLESLNIHDEWGRYGSYWFDVPDERPLDGEAQFEIDAVEEAALPF